jgi:iron(III) transport system substrate-binding protein
MKSNPSGGKGKRNWRNYPFTSREAAWFRPKTIMAATAIIAVLSLPFLARLKWATGEEVVVYTSQDQVYAEPILKEFERQTGIKARAVYDSEAVKTVGLVNRLLAEQSHPQCDIFWNNEELRTRQLDAKGVFEKWAALGCRSRRMAVNTNEVPLASAPKSLSELTNESWRGKIALAYPLFGTTATHFLALRQFWGDDRWRVWCRALAANKPFLVDGNSVAARLVAKGEAFVGLTDSDDIAAEQREGAPIVALPLTEEFLLIPNTIGLVRGSPHRPGAEQLFEYLQHPEVTEKLVAAHALEGGSAQTATNATLRPDWSELLADLDRATESLKEIFLR